MRNTIYLELKRIFAILLILNTAVILIVVYLAFTNYSSQRKSLIEMGSTVLRAFEASRPVVFTSGGNTHLNTTLEEMFNLDTINNIVIYRESGEQVFALHPEKGIIKTDVHSRDIEETDNAITLYNSFHPQGMMGMGMGRGNHMMGHGGNMMNHNNDGKVFIAISINKANLTSMRNTSILTLFAAILAELFIFFLYSRIKTVVKLYELSSIQLKNAEKEAATGRLSSVLAHEIKNPLSSMSGLLSYAKKKSNDPQITDIIETTQDEVTRLSDIVNDFLTYGRTQELEIEPVEIKPILVKTTELLKHDAREKNIDFLIEGDDFVFDGDSNKFLQIFVNLIINAIDASPENETVKICISSKNRKVSIINNSQKPVTFDGDKLFEPFLTTKTKGSGLGLSITKRLVEQHGYNISIPSTNPFTTVINFK